MNERRPFGLALVLAAILTSCGAQTSSSNPAAPAPDVAAVDDQPREADGSPRIELNLTEATVAVVIEALSLATGAPIAIDERAELIAECALISVASTRLLTPAQAFELVRDALEGTGLELEQTEGGARVIRAEGTEPPPSCDFLTRLGKAPSNEEITKMIVSGIAEQSDGSFKVSDGARRLIATHTEVALEGARVLSYERGGAVIGHRLFGVRQQSVLGTLGLRNGDILKKFNSIHLVSPEGGQEALSALRSVDEVTLEVERRGQVMLLRYRMVPSEAWPP